MIFNILSKYERKRLRREYLKNWHTWFAWYPVRVSEYKVAWLETVQRRATVTTDMTVAFYSYNLKKKDL